jgi:hypothetical protein
MKYHLLPRNSVRSAAGWLGALSLLALAALPARAWYNPCDTLTTSPSEWTSLVTNPGGTLRIHTNTGLGLKCMVATCVSNAAHAQMQKEKCLPPYPAMGQTNVFTLDVKFPTANATAITQTFFQIYEQGPTGQYKPIMMVLRDGPTGRLKVKFIHNPGIDSDDELWDLGALPNDQWFSVKFQIEFQKVSGKGWVKVWWGPQGGTQTYLYRQENVCHHGNLAQMLYCGYGNYTYGPMPFQGISNIDNVWIQTVW